MAAINSVSTANPPTSAGGFDQLSSGEFLQIIFTELANQDPLSPNDTKDILNQISTIRSIESDLTLSRNLESIVNSSEVASAGNLIGKYVVGRSQEGIDAENFVGSVTVTPDGAVLNLIDGFRVPMDRVKEIFDPALFRSTDPDTQEEDAPGA